MVSQTTVTEMDIAMTNVSHHDQCPRDHDVKKLGGELNWDQPTTRNNRACGLLLRTSVYSGIRSVIVA